MAHTPAVHAPADDEYATVAPTSVVVAVTATLVVPAGTSAVYDVVLLTNAGDNSPGAIVKSPSEASGTAGACSAITSVARRLSVIRPLPISPNLPCPQQYTLPMLVRAQYWSLLLPSSTTSVSALPVPSVTVTARV